MKPRKTGKTLLLIALILCCAACVSGAGAETLQMYIDEQTTFQTLESFGTSGCWWTQYAGLWDMEYAGGGRSVRDQIALWLYDRNFGIGLTEYRYNLGAGSADSGKGIFWDVNRRAQSFETAPGVYDWNKDAGAVWFLKKVTELGAKEITLFFNSPPERLTRNGLAHMTEGGDRVNIDPEKYGEWAVYACDAAEHFVEMGIPVRYISPINEPQWDWYNGQEGCHYEPDRIAGVYVAFLEEMQKRPALAGVELSGPESGEWGGKTVQYVSSLLDNPVLAAHMKAVDCHSYWSDTRSKRSFRSWMDAHHPDTAVRMSEWCEMVNGSDYGMDSAIVLARTLAEDLRVLNAVSWSSWVGLSPGGYHDGLMHGAINGSGDVSLVPVKRLWAYGNYSRYIRPGFVRVAVDGGDACSAVAFAGEEYGKKKLIAVLINEQWSEQKIKLNGNFGKYESIVAYETSVSRDLVKITERVSNTAFTLAPRSVTTIVFSE